MSLDALMNRSAVDLVNYMVANPRQNATNDCFLFFARLMTIPHKNGVALSVQHASSKALCPQIPNYKYLVLYGTYM
jgi:hypothetical protein